MQNNIVSQAGQKKQSNWMHVQVVGFHRQECAIGVKIINLAKTSKVVALLLAYALQA
jgi:isocitrate dehydrogenase